MSVFRRIVAIVLGIIVASLVIAGVEGLVHTRLTGDSLFAGVAGGYGLGALLGTAVATRVAGARLAIVVPALLGILATLNLFSFPHPWWFAVAAVVALALGWWIGSLAGRPTSKGLN